VGSSLHGSAGPARSLLQHELPRGHGLLQGTSTCSGVGSSLICRWIPAALWTSMGCGATAYLTMVFTKGCKGVSALAPGTPAPRPSSMTLVSAELFFSHILTLFWLLLKLHSIFSPFLICCPRGTTTITDWLGLGHWLAHFAASWHWVCRTLKRLLAASPGAPSVAPCYQNLAT